MDTTLEVIAAEIGHSGPMSFSRYMELALYHPSLGFYSRGGAGRRRDFITSPEVGPLFGAVLARALDSWWDELGQPAQFVFVDAGAGPAMLARTIRRAQPRCLRALDYVAVDVSEAQRSRHPDFVTSRGQMPDHIEVGIVLANELLDNLPFDIGEYSSVEGWQDVLVGVDATGLHEVLVPMTEAVPPVPNSALSEPVRLPMQLQAAAWLGHVLGTIDRGRVVVIDYAVDSYPAEVGRKWLRTYSRQGVGGPALKDPGSKDVTADVDSGALARVRPIDAKHKQRAWLHLHGIAALVEQGNAHWRQHAAAPDVAAIEMRSRAVEAEALLDPTGLGGFSVLEWILEA